MAPEGEPREALAALVTYARDREAEAESIQIVEEQRANPGHGGPARSSFSEQQTRTSLLVLNMSLNWKIWLSCWGPKPEALDKAQSRRKALKEAQAELAKTQERWARRGRRSELRRFAIARDEQARLRKTLTKEQYEELEEELWSLTKSGAVRGRRDRVGGLRGQGIGPAFVFTRVDAGDDASPNADESAAGLACNQVVRPRTTPTPSTSCRRALTRWARSVVTLRRRRF